MAKAKGASRRPYEYDHHYGLQVGTTGKARRAEKAPSRASLSPAKAAKAGRAAKKH
jgi:hypothetical protein